MNANVSGGVLVVGPFGRVRCIKKSLLVELADMGD